MSHTHTDSCYRNYTTCGKTQHIHLNDCKSSDNCSASEHIHDAACSTRQRECGKIES